MTPVWRLMCVAQIISAALPRTTMFGQLYAIGVFIFLAPSRLRSAHPCSGWEVKRQLLSN